MTPMNDDQAKMLHAIGTFHLRLGDAGRALALLAAVFETRPDDLGLAAAVIRCYVALGEGEAALRLLDGLSVANTGEKTRRALTLARCEALWLAGRRVEARELRALDLRVHGVAA